MLDNKQLENMQKIFKKMPQVLAVYLYGSRAGGYASKKSDLDIAVVADEIESIHYNEFYLEVSNLIKGFELDLRLATLKSDPTYLFEVIRGKHLYQRTDSDRINFETRVLKNFYDGKHIRDIYFHYLRQSFGVN